MNGRFVDLTALADRFRTDKGSIDGDKHIYTELYAACFESFRLREFNLLELGLLRAPNRVEESDPASRRVEGIPSVEMWLEFFPNANIYGFDLADFSSFQKPRFVFVRGDLSLDADIDRLAQTVPQPRIIIDDASHAAFHQQRALLKLFRILAPGGFYVIEDLHYSPSFEASLPPCRPMADVVREFLDIGTLRLDFGLPEDAVALATQISHTFMHCSTRGRAGWGPKMVIFQKSGASLLAGAAAPSAATDPYLAPAWLTLRAFRFHTTPEGRKIAATSSVERNARIAGYSHQNETAWRILRQDGMPSCIATRHSNSDGSTSLVGPLISNPGVIQNIDERVADSTLPEVCTFDLFDTLVARRCHEPFAIFRQVEAKSGVADFARLRHETEMKMFGHRSYGFDDIYDALGAATAWPSSLLTRLRMMELAEEWDNLFPIREISSRVRPEDMIVSDNYLPLSFLRRVVDEKCELKGRIIHVSNYGKMHGTIWPQILSNHFILCHHGDDQSADVESPKRLGINAEHVTVSRWTCGEAILADMGLPSLAMAIRESRLLSFDFDPLLRRAQLAQFNVNLPLLILAGVDLLQTARERHADTLLMCSRDCNLWIALIRWMSALFPMAPAIRYLLASRVLFMSDSPEYAAYYLRMRGQRSMLVDIAGTGQSASHFIGKIGGQSHTSIFLTAASTDGPGWVRALATPCDDISVDIFTEQDFSRRLPIEALNSSLEGRAIRVKFTGHSLEVKRESNEFGSISQLLISAMRDAFLRTVECLQNSDIRELPENIPAGTLRHAAEAVMGLVNDFDEVLSPIGEDILGEEQHIEAVGRAERERIISRGDAPLDLLE